MPVGWGLRIRLASLVIIAGVLVTVVALLGLTVTVDSQLNAALDAGLRARASDIVAAVAEGDSEAPRGDPFAQVIDHQGRVVSHSAGAPATAVLTARELATAARVPVLVETRVRPLRGPFRLRAEPSGRYVVVVGTGLEDFNSAEDRLRLYLGLALVLLVLLLGVGTWVLVGAALRPVARMSQAAETMSGADPRLRLPQPGGNDEIALLGRTLNGLLDRIENFVERERVFLDDASHELRTPLTVLRGELELAVDDPDPDRARRGMQIALVEAERLSDLAGDLLVLARQRGGDLQIQREAVDLGDWIESVLDDLGTAATCPATVEAAEPVTAWIDTAQMSRVLTNLVSNADAAGARRVRIRVAASREHDEVVVDVSDDGPGFDPEILPRAFERFARADRSRARAETPGSGLGLAIVAALVDAHGGRVTADNASVLGGARVCIHLPLRPGPAPAGR